jgi:hypothetical protein
MCGAIHPLPQYAFMVWCSDKMKHRDNYLHFYLLFLLFTYMKDINGTFVIEAEKLSYDKQKKSLGKVGNLGNSLIINHLLLYAAIF